MKEITIKWIFYIFVIFIIHFLLKRYTIEVIADLFLISFIAANIVEISQIKKKGTVISW